MPSFFTTIPIQIVVGIILFIALLNDQRELTILALLVLGVVGGTRLWARLSLRGLQCHLQIDRRRVFPGEQVTLTISAENAKLLPISLAINVPTGNLLPRPSSDQVLTKETSLLWYQRTQFRWELRAAQRGVYQLGPLDISAGDLFSFFSKSERAEESHSLIVYPRLVPLKPFALPRRDFFGVPSRTSPVQDPIYILGTREYQQGQPARYIHWKASARHQRLQEKVFEPTVHEKILLAIDVAPFAVNSADSDFERTLEIAASVAARFDRRGHAVGLVVNGGMKGSGRYIVPVARNDQQLAAILEALARLEMKPERNLRDLLRRALEETWGASCVYFSFEEDDTLWATGEHLTRRHTPVMFCVSQRAPVGARAAQMSYKVYRRAELSAEAE